LNFGSGSVPEYRAYTVGLDGHFTENEPLVGTGAATISTVPDNILASRQRPLAGVALVSQREQQEPMTPPTFEFSRRGPVLAYSEAKQAVVLIVEDDFLIRMGAIDMVRSAGFEVVEAKDADEAIEILERRLDITVVFTDVHMPGSMNGLKLAAAIRGRWPPIKIVATSGEAKVTTTDLPLGSRFLPKPYSQREIVGTLRELTGLLR
jgi:CheY-like chemotaxis protein